MELKACPFCKGEGIRDRDLRDGYQGDKDDPDAYAYFIRCRSCAATGGWAKSGTLAEKMWNMRTN